MANVVKNSELHRVVVSAIIYNNIGKYLVTKRAPTLKVFPDKWHVPGGGLEISDYVDTPSDGDNEWHYALENTLRREVMEEVNVEIGKPKYLLDVIFIRPDGVPVVVLSYYAPYVSGEVRLDEEDIVEFKWIDVDELSDFDFIKGIPGQIRQVEDIIKKNQ